MNEPTIQIGQLSWPAESKTTEIAALIMARLNQLDRLRQKNGHIPLESLFFDSLIYSKLKEILEYLESEMLPNTDEKILAEFGWEVECESPFEISLVNEPESRATGRAAEIILDECKQQLMRV